MADCELDVLNKAGHANFCMRCLYGLPASMAEADSSRVAVGFYCLGALDLVGLLDAKLKDADRAAWRAWIWAQQVPRPFPRNGSEGETEVEDTGAGPSETPRRGNEDVHDYVGGFRPSPFMHVERVPSAPPPNRDAADTDLPHLIMTYTALLSLAILRDDFAQLDRRGLVNLLRATQMEDGSFTAIPGQGEADIRMVYTAFAISAMLDDWSGVDVALALDFVRRCMSYEGGFGQTPGNEAQGGPTYCALATLALAPAAYVEAAALSPRERRGTLRWLAQRQSAAEGGFCGRTEKDADACYSFWCGAGLHILGANALVDRGAHARFLAKCQFRIGGLAKAPAAHADPYHTYLALAALALYPPGPGEERVDASWGLPRLDGLMNATEETAQWARARISGTA